MLELWQAMSQFGAALVTLIAAIIRPLLPWLPLIAWVGFWMFAVNWVKFRETLSKGGWIGLVLVGTIAVLIWGVLSPPPGGVYNVFGLRVSNYVEKTVYVSVLAMIMFMAGSVQLSGFARNCCKFDDPVPEDDHDHDSHGGGHGHDDHGDGAHGDAGHLIAHSGH